MPNILNKEDPMYHLGLESMDKTHAEFIDMINALTHAEKTKFIPLFIKFVAHTKDHFDAENALMLQTQFPAIEEHIAEHTRVLRDITLMSERVKKGITALARAYITDQASEWFKVHAITMDRALATHALGALSITEQVKVG